jgi:hypothetical protein
MNPDCEQFLRWLDEGRPDGLTPPLEAHAAGCDTCRRRLALDRTLRERLGTGADLEGARRAALVDRILAAVPAAPAARRHPIRHVRWAAALALAAALVVAAMVFWPRPVEPTSPTEVFGDLLGPLANMAPPQIAATPESQDAPLPLGNVLSALWGDLQGPVAVGLNALEAPRAAAAVESTGRTTPKDLTNPAKEN